MHRSFVKLLAQVSSIQLDAAAAEVFGPWVVNNLGIMDLILRETDLPGEAEGSHRDSRRKPFNGYSSCKVWRSRFLRDSKSKLSKLSKLKWTSGPVAQWPNGPGLHLPRIRLSEIREGDSRIQCLCEVWGLTT